MTKTVHRFFFDPRILASDEVIISDRNQYQQMTKVLRMKIGDRFIGLDNEGSEYDLEISAVDKKSIHCRLVEKRPCLVKSSVKIRLFQGIPKKPAVFEQILRQGTELGVSEFCPLVTHHGQVDELRKMERLHQILKEAAEQSERSRIPRMNDPVDFLGILNDKEAPFDETFPADLNLMAYARDSRVERSSLKDLQQQISEAKSVNLFVGPEGGFSGQEVELAKSMNMEVISLGEQILRTETAAIVFVSGIQLFLG